MDTPKFTSKGSILGFFFRSGLLVALSISLLSIWPQVGLLIDRGGEWNGTFSPAYFDETIYASYVNGLLEGRPLRSDPLIESSPEKAQPESFFSIQFVQPLIMSAFGRALGVSTDTVFIAFTPITAFVTSLVLFILLRTLTGDIRLATAGTFFVICFGTLAAWCGKLIALLHLGEYVSGFLFLRRYQPGLTLAVFFAFALLIYIAFTRDDKRGFWASCFGGLFFALLVFSYFYMWTAAAAWLFVVGLFWIFFHSRDWRFLLIRLLPVFVIGAVALLIYFRGLSSIVETSYKAQAFEYTREPDLLRFPLMISLIALLMITLSVRKGRASWSNPLTVFALSFSALPCLLFNQQVVTGRSLQPSHYEWFIGNYASLLGLLLAVFALYRGSELLNQRPGRRVFLTLGIVSVFMGIIEINYDERKRKDGGRRRDEFAPVAQRLRREAKQLGPHRYNRDVVFSSDVSTAADNLTSMAPQAVLWASHTPMMPSLSPIEVKRRFFLYLYFCGVGPESLHKDLTAGSFSGITALFGFERAVPSLTADFRPPSDAEIRSEVSNYEQFVNRVDESLVYEPVISWALIRRDKSTDLSVLDRWYIRESEEFIGPYTLIRLNPRYGEN